MFHTAERHLQGEAGGDLVDLNDTGLNAISVAHSLIDVARDDRCAEAKLDIVGQRDGFIEISGFHHTDGGAKDFLLRDTHVVLHIADYRGADEMTVLQIAVGEAFAAP